MLRVIGIDPSLTATGLAWGDGSTSTVTYARGTDGDLRLEVIANAMYDVAHLPMTGHRVDLAIVEDLPTHAHGAGKTGMVQGVVRLKLMEYEVPYTTIPAATLKKFATGKGDATKPDMRMELYKRTGIDLKDDNQVDAWWLRALGYQLLGDPIVELPKTHLAALDKLDWTPAQIPQDGAA